MSPFSIPRSLIELTTDFVQVGVAVREIILGAAATWADKVIVSEDLEHLLAKALHGTRTVPEDDFYRQTNIVTHIQKLSRVQGLEDVLNYYERLCEVAHPNALENARSGPTAECHNRMEQ